MIFIPWAEEAAKSLVLISRTAGTNIGDMTAVGGLVAAFDGVTSQANTACARSATAGQPGYVGKTLASPKIFGRAIIYGSNNAGFTYGANPSEDITIYGKQGSPPSGRTDGTGISSTLSFTDTNDESAGRTLNSTDLVTQWDHIWAYVVPGGSGSAFVAELVLYEWA